MQFHGYHTDGHYMIFDILGITLMDITRTRRPSLHSNTQQSTPSQQHISYSNNNVIIYIILHALTDKGPHTL